MNQKRQAHPRTKQILWLLAVLIATVGLTISASVVLSSPHYIKIDGWQTTTSLPQALASHNVVVRGDYLYLIGGKSAADNPIGTVYTARIGSNGSLSSWNMVGTLPVPVYLHTSVADASHLYVVGGWDGRGTRREIWRAAFLNDGALGAFTKIADYPLSLDLHKAVIVANRLYVLGGWNGSEPLDRVSWAELLPNGLGPWNTAPSLPQPLYRLSGVAHNNTIYVTGGFDNNRAQSTVYFSRVRGDGTLEGWQTTSQLPNAVYYQETVIHDGRLLVLGGRGDGPEYNTVSAAPINANGTIGAWTAEPSLPESLHRFAAVSVSRNGSDFVYVLGGLRGAEYRTTVYHSTYPSPPTPTPVPPTPTPTPTPESGGITLQLRNDPQHWVAPGDLITYTIAYRVVGTQPATNVQIESRVPNAVELLPESLAVNSSGNYTYTGVAPGSTIRWNLGALLAGAQGSVRYQVRRPPLKPPTIPRVLEIGLTGPATAEAATPITYRLTITNNTAFSLTNLLLVDTLPTGATYVSGGDGPPVDNRIQWTVPLLDGDSVLIHELTVTAAQTIVNSDFYISSDEGPTAKGRDVVVTVINGTAPPPSGDGVTISNTGVAASWQMSGTGRTTQANGAFNPAYPTYLPAIKR